MKVLVTGATGFVGKRLAKQLALKGHEVRILSRNPSSTAAKIGIPLPAYAWNAEKELPPEEALKELDAVIHLAGEGVADHRWSEVQKKKIRDSRILGTRNLVAGVSKFCPNLKVFLSASAIGIYGDRGQEELTESSSRGPGFLADVCQDWESELLPSALSARKASIRIGIVLGADGGALKKLLPLFKIGAGGPIGAGKQWMSWIHVDDLVSLFIFTLEHQTLSGPINGTAPLPVTNKEFTQELGSALHRPAFLPAPEFALKLAMGEMSTIVIASQKVLPTKAVNAGFEFRYKTIAQAFEEIVKKKALRPTP